MESTCQRGHTIPLAPIRREEELSRLEILSSVADIDSLKDINTLEALSENEVQIIELLNHYSKLSGDNPRTSEAAREIVVTCRQAQMSSKTLKADPQGAGSFDRLIYLLDRYLDYCASINLSAWPIDHLKVCIWIKNDVTLTTNSTRMKPLRKTVRCYVTSLESIRIKTLHLFKGFHLAIHLMKSKIILEILNSLSVERDNLEERLGGNQALVDKLFNDSETYYERDFLLNGIRSRSGDDCSKEAMEIVKASRSGEQSDSGSKPRGKTADPHIHTLLRYRNYCFLNKIPMWPIDAARVALWLNESVLISDPRSKNKKSTVSFRTVQVYLSRLEYARLKTEHLFPTFPSYGVSLYKSNEIMEILNRLNTSKTTESEGSHCGEDLESKAMVSVPLPSDAPPAHDRVFAASPKRASLSSLIQAIPAAHWSHTKKRKLSATRSFSPRKLNRVDIENLGGSSPADDNQTMSAGPRFALRDSNSRRIPSLRSESNRQKPELPSHVTTPTCLPSIPPISEWFSSSPTSVKATKGCISFILCSDEESEHSYTTASTTTSNDGPTTPLGSPNIRAFDQSRKDLPISPSRLLDSPTCHRFWSNPLSGLHKFRIDN